MSVGLSEDDQAAIYRWAASEPLIVEVRLYGSRSTGLHGPESDVDLAVWIDLNDEDDLLCTYIDHRASWQSHLTEAIGLPVQIESYDLASEWLKAAHRVGLAIYRRGMDPDLSTDGP